MELIVAFTETLLSREPGSANTIFAKKDENIKQVTGISNQTW